jgi:hypothetical protein
MDSKLQNYLSLAHQYINTGEFPGALANAAEELGEIARQISAQESLSGTQSDQQLSIDC